MWLIRPVMYGMYGMVWYYVGSARDAREARGRHAYEDGPSVDVRLPLLILYGIEIMRCECCLVVNLVGSSGERSLGVNHRICGPWHNQSAYDGTHSGYGAPSCKASMAKNSVSYDDLLGL